MSKKKKTFKSDKGYPEGKFDAGSNTGSLTAEEISEKYTVRELREILKENGLSVSGKKDELVERVLPILNDDSNESSLEDISDEDSISSTLTNYGINYDDLSIKDESVKEDNAKFNIEGFTQNGLIMSDSTISIESSDSSNVDLKMNIPEVSYSDFESTVFTFKNLDLSILPSSDPQSLELSALMDYLELMTQMDYVTLNGLNLFSKSFPDDSVSLNIDISNFLYSNFYNANIKLDDLDFNLEIGVDGQKLALSVDLPSLKLINKDYRVIVSDLKLNLQLHDLRLSDFDLSILMSDFHYTNFDDVHVDMENVNVSLEPILNSNSFDILIGMDSFDAGGITFNDMFPMLNIDNINIKTPTDDSQLPINMTGHISPLDVTQLDLTEIGALLSSGFDLDTYARNMSSLYEGSDLDATGFVIASIFENFDYSSLDSIVLNLSDLIELAGVDFADFGIDLSDYDLSAISLSEIIEALSNSDFSLSSIKSAFNLLTIGSDDFDMSGLISFDADNFDISSLLTSLNISGEDISAIAEMLENSDLDLGSIFENVDLSCLDSIELDLTGLIGSLGIDLADLANLVDLADLGIDLSDYDLSAIKASELMGILSNIDLDMSTITSALKLLDLDLSEIDLSGLIASFDADNFDLSGLLGSLDLSELDISAIADILENSDLDLGKIFENFDYSCLDSIVFNLSGLIDSLGIDLADLGIDLSDYDLSAIKVSELMGIFNGFNLDMSTIIAALKVLGIDLSEIDLSGLIASFDADNFDMSGLLGGIDLSELDISAIADMFENSDLDLSGVFENCDLSCLNAIELDLTGVIDSLGIDLADLGIDLSDYDLSAIKASELLAIFNNSDFNMSDIAYMFGGDNKPITIEDGVTDFNEGYYQVDCNVADVNFNEATGKWEYQGLELKYFNENKHNGKLSKKEVKEHNEKCQSSMNSIDLSDIDLSALTVSFDEDNFDMSGLLGGIDLSELDFSAIADMFENSDLDLSGVFDNCDLSCLDAIVLDLTGVIDSLGIDLADLGIDLSDYDLSAIKVTDLIDILNGFDLDMDTINAILKLFGLDLSEIDVSGLIDSFDVDNFDISSIMEGLDLSELDISAIADIFKNLDGVFDNCDYSCFGAIELDLTGLIDSLDIDLADLPDLGIDLSDYDLSAIKVSEIIAILTSFDLDMSTIASVLKLFGLDLSDVDFDGILSSFDSENFDLSGLLGSLDLSGLDFSAIADMFSNLDLDFEGIFENFDYSSLDVIKLDLVGFIDSSGIDLADLAVLADFGIDLSGYDLSAISLSDIIDVLKDSDFIKSAMTAMMNLFSFDWDEFDMSGLIVSFDLDELDIYDLLTSLNIPGLDISGILDMFEENGIDLTEFLKGILGMFMENTVPELTQ